MFNDVAIPTKSRHPPRFFTWRRSPPFSAFICCESKPRESNHPLTSAIRVEVSFAEQMYLRDLPPGTCGASLPCSPEHSAAILAELLPFHSLFAALRTK